MQCRRCKNEFSDAELGSIPGWAAWPVKMVLGMGGAGDEGELDAVYCPSCLRRMRACCAIIWLMLLLLVIGTCWGFFFGN